MWPGWILALRQIANARFLAASLETRKGRKPRIPRKLIGGALATLSLHIRNQRVIVICRTGSEKVVNANLKTERADFD
jgi:hypothetical protein